MTPTIYARDYVDAIRYGLLSHIFGPSVRPLTPLVKPGESVTTPHDELIDKAVSRWSNFKPTKLFPAPYRHVTQTEFNTRPKEFTDHPHDDYTGFHDAASVLAGTKPAALLSQKFLTDHPVGRSLRTRLEAAGHVVIPGKFGAAAVGPIDAASNVIRSQYKNAAAVGRSLGYPEDAIRHFQDRTSGRNPGPLPDAESLPAHERY